MNAGALLLGAHGLTLADFAGLFVHFTLLSMLAVGGAITTASDMHRYLVDEHRWISDQEFTSSIALAQAAPGPNILFVAVLGYNVAGLAGVLCTMAGIMIPSTTVAIAAARWGRERREARIVRAFSAGLAPLTIGLVLSTGYVLAVPSASNGIALALVAFTVAMMLRTSISPMWLMGIGALVGATGWV